MNEVLSDRKNKGTGLLCLKMQHVCLLNLKN
ncbi:Uncharacterised protein [Klebsiella pneumoniae]|nr:Uncharacterised protein [Klebsiella pneumoniae]